MDDFTTKRTVGPEKFTCLLNQECKKRACKTELCV